MYIQINDYRLRLTKDRPDLSSERAPLQRQDSNFQTITLEQEEMSGQKSHSGFNTGHTD
jgi:hypothetical protein